MHSSKLHPARIEAEDGPDDRRDSGESGVENQTETGPSVEEQTETSVGIQATEASGASGIVSSEHPPADIHRKSTVRLWATAAGFALVLTVLTVAGVYLITKKPSTVDQLVIQTFPSGADIRLDSKDYGHSPVKLEKVPIGRYSITITKDGFDPIIDEINVTAESQQQPLEFRLKLATMTNGTALSPEEQMKQYQQDASASFAQGHYAIPLEGSALYYAEAMLGLDQSNQFAVEMRERIRKLMHQTAQTESARGDLGRAQEIYQVLVDFYPDDEEARAAAGRLESQLSARKGEVRDLVAKAQEALESGRLVDPERASAYYYSRQALARDRQNPQARAIRDNIKESLSAESEQAYGRDPEAAIRQMERVSQLFPEDKTSRARLREWMTRKTDDAKIASDPRTHRIKGLEKAAKEDWEGAIPDLELAMTNDQGTADVVAALARAHHKLGNLDQAVEYYRMVPQGAGIAYRTAIAAMGDIAMARKDTATALSRYKLALQLGGSTLYSIETLQEKIDKIETRQRQRAAEPVPLTIAVRHQHGTLQGSCSGTLSVMPTGVRYEGQRDHTFSSNLAGMGALVSGEKLTLVFQKKNEQFKCSAGDSERFREALAKYQATFSR